NLSCNKSSKVFRFPNGEIVKQSKINEIKKQFKIRYEQYKGFISNYDDSILTSFLLLFENYNEVVGSDVISQEKINKLKFKNVTYIRFDHILKSDHNFRDSTFEKYIQKKYPLADKIGITDNSFDLKENGATICNIEFQNLVLPIYFVTLYPN